MILGKCLLCKRVFRKRERKYKFCSVKCSNNFNKNGLINIKLPKKSIQLAEFIGICLGDGYISKYQASITLNSIVDKEYVPYVMDLIRNLFPLIKLSIFKRRNENALDIRINSKILSDFLISMGIVAKNKKVPIWILNNEEYRKSCIKGLFDTEGSISFKKYEGKKIKSLYKQLNFKNSNKEIMKFVRDTLINLGLKPTLTLNKSLYLSNNVDINFFREIIGFGNPKLLKKSYIYNIEDYSKSKLAD